MLEGGLTDKQKTYLDEANSRWNVKSGAVRSGKSWVDIAWMIPRRIMQAPADGIIVLIGYTQETLVRNVIIPMKRLYGKHGQIGPVRADGKIRLFGRECYLLGAERRERAAALQGASVAYAYGDEVTTWSRDVFEMLKSRLDLPGSRFDGTCNPAGPGHWFKAFLDSGADIYLQAYTIDDNPYLPAAFVEGLKGEYAGTERYARYILGQWVAAEGLVYAGFDPLRHVVDAVAARVLRVGFACDVGHSNATSFLAVGECADGRWYVLDEYYHSGKAAGAARSPLGYARDFAVFRARVLARHADARVVGVFVDPSAVGFMAQLREIGVSGVRRARNDVLPGIAAVASRLEADGLRVLRGCGHLLRELGGYVWDARAAEHGEDRPVKVDDHAVDALRYYVFSRRG